MIKQGEKVIKLNFIKEFGKTLSSRELGKKSFHILEEKYLSDFKIIIAKFENFNVITPSYLDETVLEISRVYPGRFYVDISSDAFIKESIDFLSKYRGITVLYNTLEKSL